MQIVIDIPEKIYKYVQIIGSISMLDIQQVANAIFDGKLLPKGHGDLIDRNDLLADSYCIDDWSGNEVNIVDVMTVKMADTIIEADKEQE